ncbi:MAG: NADH-quinone oxidoreductase subunit NuoE [Motiliproteus sp.]
MSLEPELSSIERQQIDAECGHYPQRRAAAIEGLKIVQQHRGWVSDGTLKALARYLEMPEGELDGVATFYNLIFRQPVGSHVIMLCDSVCCWIKGSDKLNQYLCDKLDIQPGQTTPDGRVTLLPIVCLGDCDRAPTLMVDGQQHGNLTPDRLDQILAGLDSGKDTGGAGDG